MLTIEHAGVTLGYVLPTAVEAQRLRLLSVRIGAGMERIDADSLRDALADPSAVDARLEAMDRILAETHAIERRRAELALTYVQRLEVDGESLDPSSAAATRALLSTPGLIHVLLSALAPLPTEADAGESEAPRAT